MSLNLKYPFVAQCPICGAPVTYDEVCPGRTEALHPDDLHYMRLMDIRTGRPPRIELGDSTEDDV